MQAGLHSNAQTSHIRPPIYTCGFPNLRNLRRSQMRPVLAATQFSNLRRSNMQQLACLDNALRARALTSDTRRVALNLDAPLYIFRMPLILSCLFLQCVAVSQHMRYSCSFRHRRRKVVNSVHDVAVARRMTFTLCE